MLQDIKIINTNGIINEKRTEVSRPPTIELILLKSSIDLG